MRSEKMLDYIGQVDSKYIEEARLERRNPNWMKWCALAACILLCVWGASIGYASLFDDANTELSYICLDVNPSFELCLDYEGNVVDAIAYNEDGQKWVTVIDYKNRHYENVINEILHHEEFQKYLTEDLTFTIVSKDDITIQQKIKQCLDALRCEGNVVCTDTKTREQASSKHCSVGKYMAYEELSQYDQSVTLEDCMNMKMHEIHEQIDHHRNEHDSNQTNTDNGYKDGHHSGHH